MLVFINHVILFSVIVSHDPGLYGEPVDNETEFYSSVSGWRWDKKEGEESASSGLFVGVNVQTQNFSSS